LVGVVLAAVAACDTPHERMRATSVEQRLEAGAVPTGPAEAYGPALAPHLAGLETVATQGSTGRPFRVEARGGRIQRYPCASCHAIPLERIQARLQPGVAATHGGILRPHAEGARLTCATCHDAGSAMNGLRLMDGAAVDFDHSYQVCGQCHFQQAQAWEGGGHGKRLVGWAGPRVVRNCTGCHNPHDPLHPVSAPRWPAIVPNAPIQRAPAVAEAAP
jgi:hypothetical protein